jgi:ABC-type iron transport system FetAB ATPase subunit
VSTALRIKGLTTQHVGPIDLDLSAGECVSLAGPSGAGKTLLLRAIADLDQHTGEVWLDDKPCASMRGHEWRHHVGLLAAESQWWGETIGEHFDAPNKTLLKKLGFSPEVMTWQVAHCSTGERQRLALLRLLQNAPRVLLLDEPTASLDAENVSRVEALLGKLQRENGTAMLWVSHDSAQVQRVASRQLQLADGLLQEVG